MKINAKLFILTFSIITFISVSSAFIYHTLAQQFLQKQQSIALINSANDFIFAFQNFIEKSDEDFQEILNSKILFDESNLDFIFSVDEDSTIIRSSIYVKSNSKLYTDIKSLNDFFRYNTNAFGRHYNFKNQNYYYGKVIDNNILNMFSEKIRAEIALVEDDVITKFTNTEENQYYLPNLSKATRELKLKNNFELIHETINEADLSATHYSPNFSVISNRYLDFIIFNVSKEASAFKDTMNMVTLIIVISGILLTIIFHFLFTTKVRNQLEYINNSIKSISVGNFNKRVKIITKDEIGLLGNAFNDMLDEIEKRDTTEKEYTEFISLINKNPSLEEIGKAALQKIINITNIDIGAFYLFDNGKLNPFAVVGIPKASNQVVEQTSLYKKAIEKKDLLEIHFTENNPIIKTGITELKINYLYILPIFYNNSVIAILELASVNNPIIELKIYLNRIKYQLAIGIANAKSLSDLKKLVDELKKLNQAYHDQNIQITEKNEELIKLHERLKEGSKELEVQTAKAIESEKLKSQFLANMSHELRTPQNSILGLTELVLKDETTTPKTRERLNVVLSSGKKLLTLIENILEYSKLESGLSKIVKSDIYLSELVKEVDSYVQPLFLERNIEFIINSPEKIDYLLYCDIKKVEHIIYNLIGNATKFTNKGHIKLSLNIKNSDLIISVEDTGAGISNEDKEIIFEEFRQADANLNRKFSGTGLGLAICKKYADMLNGSINVDSVIGEGSTFTIYLPNVVKEKLELINEKNNSGIRALIISDGKESINLISDYLKSHQINVEVKNSDKIYQNFIAEISHDVIILDILLTNNNGWNLLYEIKNHPNTSKIPVVVINMDEETNCGLGLNIYDYYPKELNKFNVHAAIENIEENQSIKFRKLLFITGDDKYKNIENELISDELKIYQYDYKNKSLQNLKRIEPDLILIDLFSKEINSFKVLTELYDDLYTKSIPVVAFIDKLETREDNSYFNNHLIENTLQFQYHPLDVLKVIRDRIEITDNTAFEIEQQTSSNELRNQKSNKKLSSDNSKIKILIVDDNSEARFTIGEIVESLGYKASFATNGIECLDQLKEDLPDLVLLDIMMPVMDGFQTIKKIRENYQNLNVYALTAYAMLTDRDIIEKNGFNGLFTKPVNTAQLERKLNQIFSAVS